MISICKRCRKSIPNGDEYCDNCLVELVREEKMNDDLDHIAFEQQYAENREDLA